MYMHKVFCTQRILQANSTNFPPLPAAFPTHSLLRIFHIFHTKPGHTPAAIFVLFWRRTIVAAAVVAKNAIKVATAKNL